MNTTSLDVDSIEKLDLSYHWRMPDNRYLPSGDYSGVIVHSKLFKQQIDGRECFIIKIRFDNTQPLFVFFIPVPLGTHHEVDKAICKMLDVGYDFVNSDLIGEPVEFTVYNECGYYPDYEYTKISAFMFSEADLWEDASA